MSFLGSIDVTLTVHHEKVTQVDILPKKEVHVEKFFIGKKVSEIKQLIRNLFSLCPDSQLSCALVACHLARTGAPSQEILTQARWLNHLEMINESLRYFVLDVGCETYRSDKIQALVKARDCITKLKKCSPQDWEEIEHLWVDLRSVSSFILLDGFPTNWMQALMHGTLKSSDESLTEALVRYGKNRTLGFCPSALEHNKAPEILINNLEIDSWKNYPWNIRVKGLTGAVTRLSSDPVVSGLLTQDGNTIYTRIVARFLQTIHAIDMIHADESSVDAVWIRPGVASALVENSRGVLIHSVELDLTQGTDDPTVKHYQILTPTEINITQSEFCKASLKNLSFRGDEDLKEKASLIFQSFDPCTTVHIEVKHA